MERMKQELTEADKRSKQEREAVDRVEAELLEISPARNFASATTPSTKLERGTVLEKLADKTLNNGERSKFEKRLTTAGCSRIGESNRTALWMDQF